MVRGEREPLSVAVITLNEERNLARCLSSVAWAEDRVVLDAGSTDRTREIARDCGARVFEQPWRGFVRQKNDAVARTLHRWVLSLDADEWLTEAGTEELRRALQAPRADAFAFDRRSAFCGAFLRHAWSPDWQVRLFRKDRARFDGGLVHESLRLDPGARVERLGERLPHLAYRSIGEYVAKLDRYTDLAAASMHRDGERFRLSRLLLSPAATFFKLLVLKRGFLDGVRGVIVAGGSAFYVLAKYGKLWELERRAASGDPELEQLPPRAGPRSGGPDQS